MAEKTEKPTPKKIRDARKKGQVAHSKELISTVMLISISALLFGFGSHLVEELKALIILPSLFYEMPFEIALKEIVKGVLEKSVGIVLPFILIVIVAAIFSNVAHVGPLFTTEPVKFDLKKISPIEGFKRLFSVRNLVELLKSIFKIVFLSFLILFVILFNLEDMIHLPTCGVSCVLPFLGSLLWQLIIVTIIAFIIVGVFDVIYTKHEHTKKLRMTKDEVKREFKDSEGDPEMNGQRKRFHREMLEGGLIGQIKKSSVIVANPTHYAIGISYNGDKHSLPVITIRTRDQAARRVKRLAAQLGIPVMENVPLARALYAQGELENYIPSELIEPVAEVLKWVASLEGASGA